MKTVLVKRFWLRHEGRMYGAGSKVEVEDAYAERLAASSDFEILPELTKLAEVAEVKPKVKKPRTTKAKKVEP